MRIIDERDETGGVYVPSRDIHQQHSRRMNLEPSPYSTLPLLRLSIDDPLNDF
jgi:hypothetical protein